MKRVYISLMMIILLILSSSTIVLAENENVIKLSDSEITLNGEVMTSNSQDSVFLTNKMDNGATSETAIKSNIEISNIININKAGTYEFTGTLTDGQISVNANNIKGNVNIVLNNTNITCKNAPAIFVYSTDVENEDCKVTIILKENSINTVNGGKIKQSVEGWSDQSELLYYIDKGYDDDRQYYERYKYDGAISSDISLTFDGKGTLNVNSSKKEGIESKMHITINDGIYNISSVDDGINACTDGKSKIEINGGKVVVSVSLENAEEGDGIDSNGSLTINGGVVYAFAYPGSDNGLDSDLGVYINGGTVLSTGTMYEGFETQNNSNIIQMNLGKTINAGESIIVVDENENVVFAYKTDRRMSTFSYSSESLTEGNYTVYTGTDIVGTIDENNIYTKISTYDLSKMTKQENNNMNNFKGDRNFNHIQDSVLPTTQTSTIIFIMLAVILVIIIAIFGYDVYSNRKK